MLQALKGKRGETESKPIDSNGTSAPFAVGGETSVEADRFAARSAPSILLLATGRARVFRGGGRAERAPIAGQASR